MTTIAYRDGVLAADTQINSGNGNRAGHIRKIGRTADGWLWGFTGSTEHMADCAEWAEGREGKPPAIEGCFILISPDGRHKEWWGKGWIAAEDPQAAWGSGEKIARGAMHAGASASEAVQAAIALDTDSGGTVTVLRVEKSAAQ